MKENFYIRLEAVNQKEGHLRSYEIEAMPDLFGGWIVAVSFGRIGSRGRRVVYSFGDEESARKMVRHCLRRRASAPARIGVPYSVRALNDAGSWAMMSVG